MDKLLYRFAFHAFRLGRRRILALLERLFG